MINMKTIISKENMERETFVFYRSYFDAIELLSKKNRLLAYEAIAKYALTQEEIQDLPPQVAIILKMAKPKSVNGFHRPAVLCLFLHLLDI